MDTASVLLAMAALGIQWGYQAADDGTIEYLIQLRPEEALHLADSPSADIVSYVPDAAQPIGRIRITVGEGPLPRGDAATDLAAAYREGRLTEAQLRISGGDLDKDLAGKLVAIPPDEASPRVAQRQERVPPTTQDSSPFQSQIPIPNSQIPMPRDGITNPVHTIAGTTDERPDVEPASLDFPKSPAGSAAEEASPSDRQETVPTSAEETAAGDQTGDRPWLPLVGAIALACGFLAGNIFQWRSYQSLRKRYLQLLRKTGG